MKLKKINLVIYIILALIVIGASGLAFNIAINIIKSPNVRWDIGMFIIVLAFIGGAIYLRYLVKKMKKDFVGSK